MTISTVTSSGTSWPLSMYDLANMCGIPQQEQPVALDLLMHDHRVKIERNRIVIKDCYELVNSAAIFRKQSR